MPHRLILTLLAGVRALAAPDVLRTRAVRLLGALVPVLVACRGPAPPDGAAAAATPTSIITGSTRRAASRKRATRRK